MDFEPFRRSQYQEEGDFVQEPYEIEVRGEGRDLEVYFSRSGGLLRNGKRDPINIEKGFSIPAHRKVVKASYQITYEGEPRKNELRHRIQY